MNMGASSGQMLQSGNKNFDFNSPINLGNDAAAIEITLGAYYTLCKDANLYLELQAQMITSRTQLKEVHDGQSKQAGIAVGLQAELGKDIALANTGLNITPSAHAIYQNHSYSSFNDATSYVAKQSTES